MNTYLCTDGQGSEIQIEAESPREAAQKYVDGGDWGEIEKTTWVSVHVVEVVDPLYDASHVTGADFIRDLIRGRPETRCPDVNLDELSTEDLEELVAYLRANDPSISDDDQSLLDEAADEIEDLEMSNEPDSDRIKIALDPEEPECRDGEDHEWSSPHSVLGGLTENPGVQCHGGGVHITEVCRHCGRYRHTDSWAQDPEDGEQGLTSTHYDDADDKSLKWVLEQYRDKIIAAIEAAGLDGSQLSKDMIIAIADEPGTDTASDIKSEIEGHLPCGIKCDWTGGSDTNGYGETTSDLKFSLEEA